jgi:very-short-patch-repair endonuclease
MRKPSVDFVQAYERMMDSERKSSTGDRKKRLDQEHGHAEQKFLEYVWWPAFGHFEGLHPEYAVRDFKDGWRYLDFAFFTAGMKICVEIDGYGPHCRDITREQFADNLMRQNHLIIDGWLVIRFAYDDIIDKPRSCQQVLQQLLGKLSSSAKPFPATRAIEQAIIKLALRSSSPITPRMVAAELGIHLHTAIRNLHKLLQKELLISVNPSAKRVYKYSVNPARLSQLQLLV